MLIVYNYSAVAIITLLSVALYYSMKWIRAKFELFINNVRNTKFTSFFDRLFDKLVIVIDKILYADFNTPKSNTDLVDTKTALLLCKDVNGQCLPELKLRDKSARLIFADIKNAVCKPMRG
jgi:hypothetical protein